jgi:hypothetical protein
MRLGGPENGIHSFETTDEAHLGDKVRWLETWKKWESSDQKIGCS